MFTTLPNHIHPFAVYFTIIHRRQTTDPINIHHPQNNPIASAYKLRPYVATMFRNMRRLAVMP